MKYTNFFKVQIIILLITQIFCQNNNNSDKEDITISDSEEKEEIKVSENIDVNNSSYINISDDDIQDIEIESIDFQEPVDLTDEEMDMILLCAYLSQVALKSNYTKEIKTIADNVGIEETKKVYDKLGAEFLDKCITYIEKETVRKYITNLTYHHNFRWEKEFDKYTQIDIEKYKKPKDVKLTVEQEVLLKFLKQSNDEFEKRKREKREKNQKTKQEKPKAEEKNKNANNNKNVNKNINKVFSNSYLFENISKEIKFFSWFFLGIMVFSGIIYFIKKKNTDKKGENKKDLKKKKKEKQKKD